MSKTLIIAEAGVNHNGSIQLALELIDAAVEAGADIVKFQTFNTNDLVSRYAEKADYQKKNINNTDDTQYFMLKDLELSHEFHHKLYKYCQKKNIIFLSTAFDLSSIEFLVSLGIDRFKIPSGEITNLPYLKAIAAFKKPIILSTGMATLGEIEAALNVLESSGMSREQMVVLHCHTDYPTAMRDVHLKAMKTISQAFGVKVGYSDHTLGIEVAIAAVALGACVIEKHLTINKNLEGPDHKASTEPEDFKKMVKAIRNIEVALGDKIKRPSASELKNKLAARKSLVAASPICIGAPFTKDNLAVKRPGHGISPMELDNVIGKLATRDFKVDELIEL